MTHNFNTLCLLRRHRHRNFSAIVPAGPYKMVYSYETLTPPPAYICQYKFVHNFAGTLDTAILILALSFFFRNLPFEITTEEMYDIFGKYGAIRQIRL